MNLFKACQFYINVNDILNSLLNIFQEFICYLCGLKQSRQANHMLRHSASCTGREPVGRFRRLAITSRRDAASTFIGLDDRVELRRLAE